MLVRPCGLWLATMRNKRAGCDTLAKLLTHIGYHNSYDLSRDGMSTGVRRRSEASTISSSGACLQAQKARQGKARRADPASRDSPGRQKL